jgi:protein gp37
VSDHTKIEWTDATWNPVTGCSVTSPGCTNCYAMKLAGTRLRHHPSRAGLTRDSKAGPVWTGEVRFNEQWLTDPLRWKRPRRIFVCAHGDLFHEDVPDEWIDRVFAVMALAPQHTFQVLTKRSARMCEYFEARRDGDPWAEAADHIADLRNMVDHPAVLEPRDLPLPNVWLGVSVEDQARADERIPDLLTTPAAVRFISAEPLLGPLELGCIEPREWRAPMSWVGIDMIDAAKGEGWIFDEDGELEKLVSTARLDWVIAGGESGPGARPMDGDWVRDLRDQCAEAAVPFHFKQHGEWMDTRDLRNLPDGQGPGFGAYDSCPYDNEIEAVRVGKKRAGRLLDGVEHNGFPA